MRRWRPRLRIEKVSKLIDFEALVPDLFNARRRETLFFQQSRQLLCLAALIEVHDEEELARVEAEGLRDGIAAFTEAGCSTLVVGPMVPDREGRIRTLEMLAEANR